MRGKSHQYLGRYLAGKYMTAVPRRYVRAFLIGCVEPDRNPATYLKGSLRSQWLRGHNWGNAQNYMQRVSLRLERRERMRLLDYYTMGKLVHYTTDAFTSAHNEEFGDSLSDHRTYEAALQDYFLNFLSQNPQVRTDARESVMDTIRAFHQDYIRRPTDIHTDARFAVIVCCMVVNQIFSQV